MGCFVSASGHEKELNGKTSCTNDSDRCQSVNVNVGENYKRGLPYRDGQKVRIHFLQASKKQFPEGLAEDVEILTLLLYRKCMRTF